MGSFEKIKLWRVRCSQCSRLFSLNGGGYEVFETKEEAIDAIDMDDFWKRKGNNVYCEDCYLKLKVIKKQYENN